MHLFTDRSGELRPGWRFFAGALLLFTCAEGTRSLCHAILGDNANAIVLSGLVGAVGGSWLAVRLLTHKHLGAVGLWLGPDFTYDLGLGLLLGVLTMSVAAGLLFVSGSAGISLTSTSPVDILRTGGNALIYYGFAAATEEILFRGFLFQTTIQWVTFLPATFIFSALFAGAHFWNPASNAAAMANTFLAGVLLSLAYMKTRRLWLPIGIHWGWNFAQTTIFGFATSGFLDPALATTTVSLHGPQWWTGGVYGPEGGAAATCVLLGCIWYLLKTRLFNRPEGIVTLDSVEDLLIMRRN